MNNLKNNQAGYSLLELLVALAIIVLISSLVIVRVQIRGVDKIKLTTEQIAADLRQIRNLATARVINGATGIYPPGGYGVYFNNNTPPAFYIIFADINNYGVYDSGLDTIIAQTTLDDDNLSITASGADEFYVIFKNEHEIITDIGFLADHYPIQVKYGSDDQKGIISVFDLSDDGYTWGKIDVAFYDN